MKTAVFDRHEVVFYVLGLRDKTNGGEALEAVLQGKNPTTTRQTSRGKNVIYMERVGQAPTHNLELRAKVRKRAERRAMELNTKEDTWA